MLTGFWGLMTLVFIMFYSSNLRQQIIVPTFQPEINSDDDIVKYNVESIHLTVPPNQKYAFFEWVNDSLPHIYERVRTMCSTLDNNTFKVRLLHFIGQDKNWPLAERLPV